MSDEERQRRENPVLTGLIALVAVAVAVGLVLGGVALVGSRMLGLTGDDADSVGATERESAVIPRPQKTSATGPQVTLNTQSSDEFATDEVETDDTTTKEPKQEKAITLQAGQTAVGNFERIDLTGVYPGGEGAILQVQRMESGVWTEFDATIPVSGETFVTYVQSARTGVNKFRVVDNATGETSNPVTVTVG
ncbi:hypothetical protein DJ010_19635 [Nocardioides silvaticus]|uniref:Uncharacterized protein n=1 Tax=Nocardioides silvaticus TaxID=2201891 RepID=A0A316TCR4_9ACTN|nr:hypothetical protein [Nocardioides silvaticus]PWN01075.1 hypothetical protein DJ010_19635 [Nocardioides silvaticus]